MKAFFFSTIPAGRGCLSRGRRSTQGVLDELRRVWPPLGPRLPFVWQVQYAGPPGQAAAAGCRRWGRGCLSCGRRSAESLLDELSIPDYFFIKTSPCLHSTSVLKYPPCVPLNHCHQYTSLLKVPPVFHYTIVFILLLYLNFHSTSLFKLASPLRSTKPLSPFYFFI